MTTSPASIPRPRAPQFRFEDVPRHWFGGSAVATHVANGSNLLFPAGERFFVRSVRHYLSALEGDPVLLEQVRGFFGQEGRHAGAHEKQFAHLEAQGYRIEPFLRVYQRFAYGVIERVSPPALRLASTAACEHFTALLAEGAFTQRALDEAHPTMRTMLYWHAAEEIEHRSVAFDVLARVAPSYALRMAGLAMSAVMLAGFWTAATLTLLHQDGVSLAETRRGLKELRRPGQDESLGRNVFLRGIREYVRRDFHPSQNPIDDLAREWLAEAGLG